MITLLSKVSIIDNSGGMIGRCIKILTPVGSKTAKLGDKILVSVIKTIPGNNNIKKGDKFTAMIVRTKSPYNNLVWSENAVVLITAEKKNIEYTPVGSRIKGAISEEIKTIVGCQKLIAIAGKLI